MAKDFIQHAKKRLPKDVLDAAEVRYQELRREVLIKELRESLKVTQADLARKSGIKRPNLSRLEKQKDMQIGTLRKVVAALGGTVEIIAHFDDTAVRIALPH